MASAYLPFLDYASGTAFGTLNCRGCAFKRAEVNFNYTGNPREATMWATRASCDYMRAEFLAHFRECSEAQKLWSDSQEGKVTLVWPNRLVKSPYRRLQEWEWNL